MVEWWGMDNPLPKPTRSYVGPTKFIQRSDLIKAIREHMEIFGNDCDLNHLDVSAVTDFRSVFEHLPFTGRISKWNVSNAKSMVRMFDGSAFDGDISLWDVSKVENMQEMFCECRFNGDLSKWDVSSVTNMGVMFEGGHFNGDISAWDVRHVKGFSRMFKDGNFSGDISKWQVEKTALMAESLPEDCMAKMPCTVFHWQMAMDKPELLTPVQRQHWDNLMPIATTMGMSPAETVFWLQGQWLEKSAPAVQYALPDMELG